MKHIDGVRKMDQSFCENLLDAQCPEELRERCCMLAESKQTAQMLILLRRHRKDLLDRIHEQQKALDCLDYLIFQTEKGAI